MRRVAVVLAIAAVAATGAVLLATRGDHRRATPSTTPVRLTFTPYSGYSDTGVVWRGGTAWLATASGTENVANRVRIFRWAGGRWVPQGVVAVPELPSIRSGGYVRAAALTHSSAPDFTLNTYGADTHWFSVVALRHGTWTLVPFDYGPARTTAIDARGTQDHLVHAESNSCGCASGVETYTWFRFDGRMFVPAEPPDGPAACTREALERARPLPGAPKPSPTLHVARVACADGWALATTRHGATLALFEQRRGAWLRDLAGSAKDIRDGEAGLAIPLSVLGKLAARVGVSVGRPPKEPAYGAGGGRYRPLPWRRANVAVPVTPGSVYVDTGIVYRRHEKWLAVALEPSRDTGRRHHLEVYVFRWQAGAWTRDGAITVDFASPHRDGPVFGAEQEWVGTAAPGFSFDPFPGDRELVIARRGGEWRVVPFRTAHGDVPAVDVDWGTRTRFYSYVDPHHFVLYRYRAGALVPGSAHPDPSCTTSDLVPRRWASPRVACRYGWALVTGSRNGRRKVDVLRAVGGRWRSWLVEDARYVSRLSTDMGIAPWVLVQLTQRVSR